MLAVPLLLGHRGARAISSVAGNTVSAFDFALQHGCDGFEFDVRLTRDNVAIVCHDPQANELVISRSTAAQFAHLSRLEAVLARYAKSAFLDIELKVPGIEEITLATLREHPPQRGFVVSSFLPQILSELKKRDAAVPLAFICDKKNNLQHWRELPADYVIAHHSLITPKLVNEVSGAGRKIMAWTVNSKALMLRFADWGVHGIISDRPELLVRTLRTTP